MKKVVKKQTGNGENNIRFINAKSYKPVIGHTYVEYRTKDGYEKKQVATVELHGKDEVVVLEGKPLSRFLSIIEFGRRKFSKALVTGKTGAQRMLTKQYKASTMMQFQLQEEKGHVIRVTSERYVGVENSLVEEIIEKRLQQEGIEFEKKSINRYESNYRQFELKNMKFAEAVGMTSTIAYFNLNTGLNALQVVGGAMVQVCSNGLIVGKALKETERLVHKQDMKEYERKINIRLGQILEVLEVITKDVVELRKIKVTIAQAKSIISHLKIAKYMQEAIENRLFVKSTRTFNGKMDFDGTLYGVYMAMTYVGTHTEEMQMSRNRMTTVNIAQTMKMQALETLQDGYASYQKQTKESKKPKVIPRLK